MRTLNLKRVITALAITIFVFALIFSISYAVSYFEYQRVGQQQEAIIYEIASQTVMQELNGYLCKDFTLNNLNEKLDSMGSIIGLLEKRFSKEDSRVIDRKKVYSVLEAEHYISLKKYKESCNQNMTLILFFYSNKPNFVDEADKDGFILSTLKIQYPENVFVYSFDYDLDIPIIAKLKQKYSINQPNQIIVNEYNRIAYLSNIDDLTRYI